MLYFDLQELEYLFFYLQVDYLVVQSIDLILEVYFDIFISY